MVRLVPALLLLLAPAAVMAQGFDPPAVILGQALTRAKRTGQLNRILATRHYRADEDGVTRGVATTHGGPLADGLASTSRSSARPTAS